MSGSATKSDILGVSLGFDYEAGDITRFAEAMAEPDQAAVFSHYEEFERVVVEGEDCFVSGGCEHYLATDDLYAKIALGIEFWSNYDFALRWLDMPDGSTAMLHQMSGPEPTEFSVDFVNVYQQYAFSYVYTNSSGNARRVQALWADGELLSSDAAEGSYLALSITTMKNANSDVNDWMASE